MNDIFAKWAEKIYVRRNVFLIASLCTFAIMPILATLKMPVVDKIIGLIGFPGFIINWGIYLMCVWFHPNSGSFRPNVSSASGSGWLASLQRMYATWFLATWFVFGILVGPIILVLF